MKPSGVTVLIPARNESATIRSVVQAAGDHPLVSKVIVVDNGSTDGTGAAAARAGAQVVVEPVPGLGRAMKCGLRAVETDLILRTDADITNWTSTWIEPLCQSAGRTLTRGTFTSPHDDFPVTRLVVRPYLEIFVPPLASILTPLSGTYCLNVAMIDLETLPDDWAWDIALLVGLHQRGVEITDVHLGVLVDRHRDLAHYEPMARDIHRYFLSRFTEARIDEVTGA